MKIEDIDKRLLEIFKEHKAKLTKVDDSLSILDFARPNTNSYKLRVVFDGACVFISGDIGTFVYRCTWNVQLKDFFRGKTNLGYFFGKLEASEFHSNTRGYSFSSSTAIEQIKSIFEEREEYQEAVETYNCCKSDLEDCKESIKTLEEKQNKDEDDMEELKNEKEALEELQESLEDAKRELEETSEQELLSKLIKEAHDCSTLSDWNSKVNYMSDEIINKFDYYLYSELLDLGKDICTRIQMHYAGLVLAAEQLYKKE